MIASDFGGAAAVDPFVEVECLEGGYRQVTQDAGDHQADEEDQRSADQVRNEPGDVGQQTLHGCHYGPQIEYVQNRNQAKKPDDQGNDLPQAFAKAVSVTGMALEKPDIVDQLGERPFRCPGQGPGDDQYDDRQHYVFCQLHCCILVKSVIAHAHRVLP